MDGDHANDDLPPLEENEWHRKEGDRETILSRGANRIVVRHFGEPHKVFHRNGKKFPSGRHVRALICELRGVRIYVQDGSLIMTTEDLYP